MVGLAAVILLIGLASAIFSAANRERPAASNASSVAAVKLAANTADPANEPLAELGVAPSADVNSTPAAGKR